MTAVREATEAELGDWDARTVDVPGGHVFQSRAWAEHRRRTGWRPRFHVVEDGGRVLTLERRWPVIPGGSAYIPRGPVPLGAGDTGRGRRQVAASDALASAGIDVVAADPEVPAEDEAFRHGIRAAGFRPIEEIQPSRHRLTLPLGEGSDEEGAFSGIAKSTRQRIRKAERAATRVVRFDTRADDGAGDGFDRPVEEPFPALDRFYSLLLATGERRDFRFGPRREFVAWWRRAHAAGHLVLLEAHVPDDPAPVAGLLLYRHGARLSTVHSGDRAESRRDHPGALHLLRWRAIQLAIREGCDEMDLGGVDVAGARRVPREGEPMHGLYKHKLSFGARWLALAGAHERVIRPWRYRAGRIVSRVERAARR